MNNDEADTLYDLMPKTYRLRVTRDQFRLLFPRRIEPVVAGPQSKPAGRNLLWADAASCPESPRSDHLSTARSNGRAGSSDPAASSELR
jgi:hypothetical protein